MSYNPPNTKYSDEEMHKIVRRVFGTRGAEPCNDPGMLECRMWECQEANQCVRSRPTKLRQVVSR